MCELLGISCSKETNPSFSFAELQEHSRSNPTGWGIGFYQGNYAEVIVEPKEARYSRLANYLRQSDYLRSNLFISHIRLWRKETMTFANCHPFKRELGGKHHIFAHNGSVSVSGIATKHYTPIGSTDSEKSFCILMDRLKEQAPATLPEKKAIIQAWADEMTAKGGFNFLFSDSEYLYAYWSGYNSLFYTERKPPYDGPFMLKSSMLSATVLEKPNDEKAVIVATEKLTENDTWKEMPKRKLVVIKEGVIVK